MKAKQALPVTGPSTKPLRVLFLGMRGQFSERVFTLLLQAGTLICGVLVPAVSATAVANNSPINKLAPPQNKSQLPLLTPFANANILPNVLSIAWTNEIPVYEVQNLTAPATAEMIDSLQPDVACVACFNKRIPPILLQRPPYGFWNVHPSLLPAYRGPAPLFWQFRAGSLETGVTIHQMDAGLDTGNILCQRALPLPDGLSDAEADQLLAEHGADLLINALKNAVQGALVAYPQPDGGSSFSWPQAHDFHIPVTWSSRRAFNFMRGTAAWQMPFIIKTKHHQIKARAAIAFDPNGVLSASVKGNGRTLSIQFNPGTLTVSKW